MASKSFKTVLEYASNQRLDRKFDRAAQLSLQDAVRSILPRHRAAACMRHRLGTRITVSKTASGATRLGGVMICGAHHICPVCHSRKLAAQKAELSRVVAAHVRAGGSVVDAVLTVQHHAHQKLTTVLKKLDDSWKTFRSEPVWRELVRDLGVVGFVRRLEVTVGPNGWHPHLHVSFLCDPAVAPRDNVLARGSRQKALDGAFAVLWSAWRIATAKAGAASRRQAFFSATVNGAIEVERIIQYTMKNMGYSHDKDGSLTPIDLLRIARDSDPKSVERLEAARLFREYADAIRSKRAVMLGGVARTLTGLDADDKEEPEVLGTVSAEAYDVITKHPDARDGHLRAALASVTSREGLIDVVKRAAQLAGHPKLPDGWLTLKTGRFSGGAESIRSGCQAGTRQQPQTVFVGATLPILIRNGSGSQNVRLSALPDKVRRSVGSIG